VSGGSTTAATASTTASTTLPTLTLTPFFSGIALDVTPQIDENNAIILHVHPSVSVVSERNKNINLGTLGNYSLPLASSSISETDSIVRVPDGNIVAIGGLMSQEQNETRAHLPGTSDLPVVGNLFGNRSRSYAKRELVILVKPTVIKTEQDWAEDIERTRERMSNYSHPGIERILRP
jgi:MSHA biogenesis protein MshL